MDESPANGVGERLREFRKRRGLTLQQLGECTGYSPSYLSQVENARANVTLDTLQVIASALQVHLADLFSDQEAQQVSVIRSADQRTYGLQGGGTEHLLFSRTRTALQVAIIELPGGQSHPTFDSHAGEEFTYALSGRLRICLGETVWHELEAGDIIYYSATTPHRWENPSADPVSFMVVNTPASF